MKPHPLTVALFLTFFQTTVGCTGTVSPNPDDDASGGGVPGPGGGGGGGQHRPGSAGSPGGADQGEGGRTGGADGTGSTGGNAAQPAVVYYRDIKPLLAAKCGSCHSEDGIGPFSFDTYDEAEARANLVALVTRERRMPPWMPSAACSNLADPRVLTEDEIATIDTWVKLGAPAGDPADEPQVSAEEPVGKNLGQPDVVLDTNVAYQPLPTLADDYHCFVLDPKFSVDGDLVGYEVKPGNRPIVHHVILYAVPSSQVAAITARDAAEDGPGFTCFGFGDSNTQFVGAWVPGSGQTALPAGTALRVPAGSRIVMQIHYNTLNGKGTDRTTAELFLASGSANRRATILPIAQTSFRVPAGQKDVAVTTQLTVPSPSTLWGVAPHMHVFGTKIKVEIVGGAANRCLVDIPKWDFNWQQFYFYAEPVKLAAGTTLRLSCTYDNSVAHQPVVDGQRITPRDLRWGEGTLDEMCLNYVYVTSP